MRYSDRNKCRRPSWLIAVLSVTGFLGACAVTPNGPEDIYSAQTRYPISVDPVVERLEIPVSPDTIALSAIDEDRLRAFLSGYKQAAESEVTIVTPTGTANASAAINMVAEVSEVLVAEGIAPSGFRVAPYRPADGNPSAPVFVTYSRLVASSPQCGDWSDNYALTPRNLPPANFGCATQNNLAAMVADPRDLVRPRAMSPAYTPRRDDVLDKYRQGQPTATERSEEESGAVSDVDQ